MRIEVNLWRLDPQSEHIIIHVHNYLQNSWSQVRKFYSKMIKCVIRFQKRLYRSTVGEDRVILTYKGNKEKESSQRKIQCVIPWSSVQWKRFLFNSLWISLAHWQNYPHLNYVVTLVPLDLIKQTFLSSIVQSPWNFLNNA